MRNLVEFPITRLEIIQTLKTAAMEATKDQSVGDMQAVILLTAALIVSEAPEEIVSILTEMPADMQKVHLNHEQT